MSTDFVYEQNKLSTINSFVNFSLGREIPLSPLRLYMEITNYCNIRCAMCTQFSAISPQRLAVLKQKDRGVIEVDDIGRNITSLLKNTLQVICTGYGEPTVHPHFRDVIKFMSDYGVLISFISNGQLLDAGLADFLVDQGVYKIMLSCSGATADEYEKVYIGGKYDKFLGGLKRIQEAKARAGSKYPIIEVNSLGFAHHVAKFDTFVDIMSDHGVDIIYLKTLQGVDGIPELFEHKAILRSWIEGEVIKRALEIGKKRGVTIALDPSLAIAHNEQEYRQLTQQNKNRTTDRLHFAKFGDNTIDSFDAISKSILKTPQQSLPLKKIVPVPISSRESLENVNTFLNIKKLKDACSDGHVYHCMEPFTTMYIYKDLDVAPCCFGMAREYSLGSLKKEDGLDVWHGAGFTGVRNGVFSGKYSKSMCLSCLKNKLHPAGHNFHFILTEYAEWYKFRFGRDLLSLLHVNTPDIRQLFAANDNDTIVIRHCLNKPDELLPSSHGIHAESNSADGVTKKAHHKQRDAAKLAALDFLAWLDSFPQRDGFPHVSVACPSPATDEAGSIQQNVQAESGLGRGLMSKLLKMKADFTSPALVIENRSAGLDYGIAESLVYPKVVIADTSPTFLCNLKAAFAARPLDHERLDYAVFGVGEAHLLPPGSLSLLVLRHRINRILDVEGFLSACARALVPGGVLAFEEPFQEGLLLMGALAQFIPAVARDSGIELTDRLREQLDTFTATMKFYSRRDADKSKAGVKHLFRLDELYALCAARGLEMEFHGNANFATLMHPFAGLPPHWFRTLFRGYLRNLMGFGEDFAQLYDATIAKYCDYIDEGGAGSRGPLVTGVCLCRKGRTG
jgi:MoaA/NifB/PqqE/SkfB family radical SAM enzyme